MQWDRNLRSQAAMTGYSVLGQGSAIIWMSAGNSHFSQQVIDELLTLASTSFSKIIVMAPDQPAEHTFRALGYEGNEVRKKARLNANLLQNRARRAIAKLGDRFTVVEWMDDVANDKEYLARYEQILKLYEHNDAFRTDARETTSKVLISKSKEVLSDKTLDEGVKYLLKELAIVGASPKMYDTVSIAYVYHHRWPIYEKFVDGTYDRKMKKELGSLLAH